LSRFNPASAGAGITVCKHHDFFYGFTMGDMDGLSDLCYECMWKVKNDQRWTAMFFEGSSNNS